MGCNVVLWVWALVVVTSISSLTAREDCGVSMSNGVLSSNCSGVFTVRTMEGIELHTCGLPVGKVYKYPVEVFRGDCKDILLDHSFENERPGELCYLIMIPVLSILSLTLFGLVMFYRFKVVFKIGKADDVELGKAFITVKREHSCRELSWGLIFLALFCCKRVNSACVPLMHAHEGSVHSLYSFNLKEGDSACFNSGVVRHTENVEVMELTFLYNTSSWDPYVWSKQACGYGDCGSSKECTSYGTHGKLKREDGKFYMKYCSAFDVRDLSCFWKWGCWLGTTEVITKNHERLEVFQVGSSRTKDDYVVDGLEDCDVTQENLDPVVAGHLSLVVRSDGTAWLCPDFSQAKKPTAGMIGDIQWLADEPIFDFTAFKCEFTHASSSGDCEVEEAAIPKLLSNCQKIPGPTSLGVATYEDKELKIRGNSGRRFNIRCPSKTSPMVVNHDCHSMVVSLHGVKSEGRSLFLSVRASSVNSSSVLVLNSTCGDDPLVVPCDDQVNIFKVTTPNMADCYPGLGSVLDNTRELVTDSWVWELSDHAEVTAGTHLGISATVLVIIIVVIIVLLLLRR